MPIVWTFCFIADVLIIGSKIALSILFLRAMFTGWGH